MDHSGALRHPADDEAARREGRDLRLRVGRQDRVGRVVAAVGGERRGCGVEAGDDAIHRQRSADDAGREDDDLLGREAEQPGRVLGGRDRVELALRAGGGVGDARVDDDRLRLGGGQMPLRDDDGGGQDAVLRPHRGAGRGNDRAEQREVALLAPDLRMHARGDEALGRRDAHTSTPCSRSPAISEDPARGSRSGRPGRLHPCRGCRARRSRSRCPSPRRRRRRSRRRRSPERGPAPGLTPSGRTRTTALPAYASSSRARTSALVWT